MEENNKNIFFDQISNDRKSLDETYGKIEDSILNSQKDISKQHRDLLKYLITISITILAAAISTKSGNLNKIYFDIGSLLYICNIFFSLSYLRETLDGESLELTQLLNKYRLMSYEHREIAEKYLLAGQVSKADFEKYLKERDECRSTKIGKEDYRELIKVTKEKEEKHELTLEYLFEIIIFLFIAGSFFLGIFFADIKPDVYQLIIVLIILLWVSFTDYATRLSKKISEIITWVKRK